MSVEIKEDDLFQYLMNSDFHEEYSPEEYKFLLNKWRYYYRLLHGQYTRLKGDVDFKLEEIKIEKNNCEKIKEDSNKKVEEIENKLKDIYSRRLTFNERILGKLKIEDESK